MTKAEIQKLVNEGFEIDRQIKPLEARREEIKEVLATAANGEPCEFVGTGCKAKIGFVAYLAKTLPADKEAKARELAGTFFDKLFCRAPIAKFKDIAAALLGAEAPKLIKLLNGVPGPRVSFEEA